MGHIKILKGSMDGNDKLNEKVTVHKIVLI